MRHALACLAVTVIASLAEPAVALDRTLYAELLARHTQAVEDMAGTRVDYAGLRADPAWRRLVDGLAAAEPPPAAERAAALAFWIDVYNVLAIDWIVREGPVESIRDLGNLLRPVWKKGAGRVGGRERSLDEIEHRILRPMGEPRIHFAIVCASTSCPSLRREPYRAADLERQLDEQTRAFVADPRKGLAVDRADGSLRLSKIFDWFGGDFAGEGLLAFVARHAPEAERGWILRSEGRMGWLPYDWNVNALPGRE